MRQTRLHLLLATILTVNLIGVGALVARVGRQRPLVVSTAATITHRWRIITPVIRINLCNSERA